MIDSNHSDLLEKVNRLHFVGIGGSGMCPLAEILHGQGYTLTGSDNNETDTLARIRSYGIPVTLGHAAENIGDAEAVVYTAAVMKDNPELLAAREKGIPVIERSILLGILSKKYSNTIGVSGTHGKTTTTSMITQIFMDAKLDPTVVIGGKLSYIGGNGRLGHSDNMVVEACEFVDTFLQLTPAISVILNVDEDHLDYFGTLENIINSFRKFSEQTSKTLVVNGDDENSLKAVEGLQKELITFGLGENNRYRAVDIVALSGARTEFSLLCDGEFLVKITLGIPGKHHIYNEIGRAHV